MTRKMAGEIPAIEMLTWNVSAFGAKGVYSKRIDKFN